MINRLGRHDPVSKISQATSDSNNIYRNALEAVFNNNRDSEIMDIFANDKISLTLKQCCLEKKTKLFVDSVDIWYMPKH